MMRELDYQARVLANFDDYLSELAGQRKKCDAIAELKRTQPDLDLDLPDFAGKTWEVLRSSGRLPGSRTRVPFSPRQDGVGRSVPNAVIKVPTGGGKTYLAVSMLSRLFDRIVGRNTGFVLWIVPNEAIYSQTRTCLCNRQHPYREVLDRAAAGRVRIMEKTDPLDVRDVDSHLCVMLLMLQSANRETKETLKIFQDRGDVHGFFPAEGELQAHKQLLEEIPNLDPYADANDAGSFWPLVKDSLGNALRLLRPVVVLDEGHRAISNLAFRTLYGFNPRFVLELTATPRDVAPSRRTTDDPGRSANVLVEVMGTELDREGMIKMPLNLEPRHGTDWRSALNAALDKLRELDAAARRLYADRGRYIRPIMLVQVERTGSDQRDGAHIHTDDVVEWLWSVGVASNEIAIKTSETNDLRAPENQDLLSPTNTIRVIVTKQALQEGWDCPFAYVLCSLAASSNLGAMTQLVGRILRQPHAEKTGVGALDECYVITHHARTEDVVRAVKQGLEEDGLADLVKQVRIGDPATESRGPRRVVRRDRFRNTDIYLPLVLSVGDGHCRPLDYEADILFDIDWNELDVSPLAQSLPANWHTENAHMHRLVLAEEGPERIVAQLASPASELTRFDPVHAVRVISDIVPNPWVAREIVGRLMEQLEGEGLAREKLDARPGWAIAEMRRWLDEERDAMAEKIFRTKVADGRIQFRLRMDGNQWQMPYDAFTLEPEGSRPLLGTTFQPLVRSLFDPLYEGDFSSQDKRDVAVYLNGEEVLQWWHRNVARAQYSLQGWRKQRVYPDFIFSVQEDAGKTRVLEMKGDHLAGNPDTMYKSSLLQLMSGAFCWDATPASGKLELVYDANTTVECDLVLMRHWKTRLPALVRSNGALTDATSSGATD